MNNSTEMKVTSLKKTFPFVESALEAKKSKTMSLDTVVPAAVDSTPIPIAKPKVRVPKVKFVVKK